jgi:hypothetical protein
MQASWDGFNNLMLTCATCARRRITKEVWDTIPRLVYARLRVEGLPTSKTLDETRIPVFWWIAPGRLHERGGTSDQSSDLSYLGRAVLMEVASD